MFDEMIERDEVCYVTLIRGMAQNSRAVDALSVFVEIKGYNVELTMHSVLGALRVTIEMATLEQCRILRGHAVVIVSIGMLLYGVLWLIGMGK